DRAGPYPWKKPCTTYDEPRKVPDDEFTNQYISARIATTQTMALKKISGAGWDEARLPEEVLEEPGVIAVLRGIDSHSHVSWRLPTKVQTSGGVLNHAVKTMLLLQARFSPMIFKFGFTHDAARRWDHSGYGYRFEKDRWQEMIIIYLSREKSGPSMLEAALIDKYQCLPGCRNILSGGDGIGTAHAPCKTAILAAKAVVEEIPQAATSSIGRLARCDERNGERDVHRLSRRCHLSLPVKMQEVIVQGTTVPVLLLSSWLCFMMSHNMWHVLSGLDAPDNDRSFAQWGAFWEAYRGVCPQHPIFARAAREELCLQRTAAFLLHGDEGRTRKKSAVMVLSAHSILGHTWATRYLMGVLTKPYYDHDNGEAWFQDYLKIFTNDLLELYECFMNVSKQSNSRKPGTGICHACLADRGDIAWEDFSAPEPGWRRTLNQISPFRGCPALLSLPHDRSNSPSFLGQDCFHAWHLGAAKQFLGSCLVLLADTFPGTSIPRRFDAMSAHFLAFCKDRKINPNIRKLTRLTVGWPSKADYPCGSWNKGSTSTAILRWFLFACEDRSQFIDEGSLLHGSFMAAKQIYQFFSKSFKEHVWIPSARALQISGHGFDFLKLHEGLAKGAHATGRALFMYMPNLHRLHHLFYILYDDAKRFSLARNILMWDCQIEEDFI
ncbi:unnamed protein product, partial [Symbiodinium sp. CCMP2456]